MQVIETQVVAQVTEETALSLQLIELLDSQLAFVGGGTGVVAFD